MTYFPTAHALNTDTRMKWTLWHIPLVSVLTGSPCMCESTIQKDSIWSVRSSCPTTGRISFRQTWKQFQLDIVRWPTVICSSAWGPLLSGDKRRKLGACNVSSSRHRSNVVLLLMRKQILSFSTPGSFFSSGDVVLAESLWGQRFGCYAIMSLLDLILWD